mmetsp:Transcript_104409/g.304770  ORF Transcript_104409/g.304770 Transcript_104409/m.304770 type:complete len:205 (-) Transcript_104409:21-635(-)
MNVYFCFMASMSCRSSSARFTASLLGKTSPFSAKSSAERMSFSACSCMAARLCSTCGGIRVTLPAGLQLPFSRPIQASASKTRPSRKRRKSFSYSNSYFSLSGWSSNCFLRRSECTFVHVPGSRRVFLNQLSSQSLGQKPTRKRLQTFLSFQPSALCCSWRDLSRLGPMRESSSFRASSMPPVHAPRRGSRPSGCAAGGRWHAT